MITTIVNEAKRGCGYRQPGGLYLTCAEGVMRPCGKLPLPLKVCPTCHGGIHPARGWSWIDPRPLFAGRTCLKFELCSDRCIAMSLPERAGLLWIGEKFYPTPQDFTQESRTLGVSRRISAVPRDFIVGTTWVFVAHRKACTGGDGSQTPGLFHAFRPTHVEYVLKGIETEADLQALERRGLTLVRLVRTEAPVGLLAGPMAAEEAAG